MASADRHIAVVNFRNISSPPLSLSGSLTSADLFCSSVETSSRHHRPSRLASHRAVRRFVVAVLRSTRALAATDPAGSIHSTKVVSGLEQEVRRPTRNRQRETTVQKQKVALFFRVLPKTSTVFPHSAQGKHPTRRNPPAIGFARFCNHARAAPNASTSSTQPPSQRHIMFFPCRKTETPIFSLDSRRAHRASTTVADAPEWTLHRLDHALDTAERQSGSFSYDTGCVGVFLRRPRAKP